MIHCLTLYLSRCAQKLTLENKNADSDDRNSVTSLPILVEANQIKVKFDLHAIIINLLVLVFPQVSTINELTNGIEINPAGNIPDENLEKVVCNRISTLSSKALNTDHGSHAKV